MTNRLLSALAACFPVFVIAGFMPIALYNDNASGLEFDIALVHLFLGFGAMVCGLILAVCLLFRVPRVIVTILWGLGAIVLLADVFAPVQLGKLDGTNRLSDEPLTYTLIELALALTVVALLVISRRRERNLPLLAGFSGLLLLGVNGGVKTGHAAA